MSISENDLKKFWNEYAYSVQNESPNLFSILVSRSPVLKNNTEINVEFVATQQELDFLKEKEKILNFLKIKLQNNKITIKTSVLANIEIQHNESVAPSERLRAMTIKNPALEKLCTAFNLVVE